MTRRLISAGVHLRTGTFAQGYADGKLWCELEGPLDADLVVALPRLHGPDLPGLPDRHDGFVPVDERGRVRGVDRVWAVGDMTTRQLKHGGLATQQADVAAADIVARLTGHDVPVTAYAPMLQGLLLTGEEPLYLERRPPRSDAASASFSWKVAGRHLGPYLETLGAPLPR